MATWTGIRKKLEEDYLCPALRGRIRYLVTRYRESHDQEGRVAILLDGEEVLKSSYITYISNFYHRWNGLRQNTSAKDAAADFKHVRDSVINDGCFDRRHFYDAFQIFDNQSIEESLDSSNPLVRILALLDRRVGKRRLTVLESNMEQELPWVRVFYHVRLEAEGLSSVPKKSKIIIRPSAGSDR